MSTLDLGPAPKLLFLASDPARVREQLAGAQLTRAQAGPLRDDVSTDEITPVRILSHYDDRLARFPYTGFEAGGDTPIGPGAVQAGGFQVVVAGRRYGKGSSREHSPAAELLAGVRLVIAESFERIYRQNADNIGLFTSTDYGLVERLRRGEAIPLDELVAGRDALAAAILRSGGLLAFGQAHLRGVEPAQATAAEGAAPRTLFEKIVARHVLATPVTGGDPQPGEGLFVRADWRFIHEYYTGMAAHMLHAALGLPLALHEPASILVFEDHTSYVEESPAHLSGGLVANMQAMVQAQRDFAAAYGLRSHRTLTDAEAAADDGGNVAGISHAMMAEHYALPGQVVAGTDSHTPHSGALGCLAFGVGTTDMANAFVTGAVRLTMPQVLRVELDGLLPEGVSAKDVVLHLLQLPALRAGGGIGKVFEFTGSAVGVLSTDERATLTNMTAELGGLTGIVAPDAETVRFLKERRGVDVVLEDWMVSDPGARYCETLTVGCSRLVPMVAAPGDPGNGMRITDLAAPVKVDIAYGGSCTAGKREDFDRYHAVLAWGVAHGLRVPPSVRLYLQYGTTAVRDYCVERGYDKTFAAAGARILQPSCGACANCGPGASTEPGQVTVSAINRNFPGRSGPGQVWLASPATVMASALAGELVSFGQLRARTAPPAKPRRSALAIAEERLKLALAASQLALWDLDLTRGRVYLTEGWSLLLGGPPVPTETTSAALMAMVPEEDRAAIDHALRAVLTAPDGASGHYSVEHRLRRPDGGMMWLRSQGEVAERDASGRALRMIGTNRDVTRERRTAQELREARDAADAANRAKSQFLATISHEIRTPLNGIVGLARLLLDEPLQPRGRQQAELIDSSAQTLLALVNDVLDFSKIEAGQLAIENITFDLHALVAEVATLYKLRATEKSLLFRLHLDAEVPRHVRGDPGRIRQILGNLLGNALKFTRRGWVGLHVGVATQDEAPMLEFVISDTGAGIPADMQPRLFTPFVQGDTAITRKYGGTGLGLSIVKQLCEAMGGSVRLRSREGRGTKFTVTLPREEAAADHISSWQELLPAAPPARILVAEDNTTNQVVVMGMLDKLGYGDVALAQNGRQALEMARGNGYDIILMDCHMPEMDGYEATRLLREAGCKAAIVAMTANAIKGDRERCLAAGMDDYLTKPIGLREFGETVAAWAARGGRSSWSTLSPTGDLAPSTLAAALPAPPPEPPVFDAAGCLERYGNDEQLLALSVHTFLQVTPGVLDQLEAAAQAGDAEALRRQAHTVKGSSAMVGAERLSFHAAQLETESATLAGEPLAARVAALRRHFEDYRETMRPAS
jgi:3-isopropylmalate/(R)-2-methylmalate dehydratase large subunit